VEAQHSGAAAADPWRWARQIFLNLLSNAKKYTEEGQIIFGAEVMPPRVHFWVTDTGMGIDPEEQERIFEPFVTLEDNRCISGGIGLGLSITRHPVALHAGSMELDSRPGKGSTFHIYLPLPALDTTRPVAAGLYRFRVGVDGDSRVTPHNLLGSDPEAPIYGSMGRMASLGTCARLE
jgi:light-regulated signal transduction histidine kinase (bacteriophytochrome)